MMLSPTLLARQGAKLQHFPRLMAQMCGARRPTQVTRSGPARPYCAAAAAAAAESSEVQAMPEGLGYQQVSANQFSYQLVHVVDVFGRLAFNPTLRTIVSQTGQTFQVTDIPLDAVTPGAIQTEQAPQRVHLELWNDMAVIASQQLQRGDWVEAHGLVQQDRWTDRATQNQRVKVKVSVKSIKKVVGVPEQ